MFVNVHNCVSFPKEIPDSQDQQQGVSYIFENIAYTVNHSKRIFVEGILKNNKLIEIIIHT